MNVSFRYLLATLTGALLANAHAAVRETPADQLLERYDVIIAGAGTGGFGAAWQAARMGATVLVLEETDWIGGQAMAAGVTSMDEGPILVRERGVYRDFVEKVVAHYQAVGTSAETAYGRRHICMEPKVGQDILYAMLDEARAHTKALHVALRSPVTEVRKEGDRVTGVEIESTTAAGRKPKTIQCQMLVDATEWGDVLPLTGARFRVGNFTSEQKPDPKRLIQDLTWTAGIKQYPQGVPAELQLTKAPPGYESILSRFQRTLVLDAPGSSSERPWGFKTFVGYRGMPNSEQPTNPQLTRTHVNFNNDYPVAVGDFLDRATRTTTERAAILRTLQTLFYIQHDLGRSDWAVANDQGFDTPFNREQMDALVQAQPELEPYRAILYHFSVMAYARESRRIFGLHTLTTKELERIPGPPVQFPTGVALGDYPVDLHGSKKADVLELDLDQPGDAPVGKFGQKGSGPFSIPFECFIPEKIDGFLAAEKNLSQSRLANGATRLQPSTMLMGQAVGAMAKLAIDRHLQPRALAPELVQRVLLEDRDTLCLQPIKDVARGGAEWIPVQMAATHNLLLPSEEKFRPLDPVTGDDLARITRQLSQSTAPAAVPAPVKVGAFLQALAPSMATAGITLEPVTLSADAEANITRVEAAQLLSDFLFAKAEGRPMALGWRAMKSLTPVPAAEKNSELATSITALAERKLIDSPEPWLQNAVAGSTFDGGAVRDLFTRVVLRLRPGTPAGQIIAVAQEEGLITSAGYWEKYAVPGGKCRGELMAIVLRNMAVHTAGR